jgi:hypothetical protein
MADGVVEYILRLTDKTKAGTRSAVQGSEQLENQTKQTTQAVDKLGDESAQTSRQLDRMGKQSRGTSAGLTGLSRGLGGALSSVSGLAGGVGGLVAALGVGALAGSLAAATRAMVDFGQEIADLRNDITDASTRSGIAADTLQGLRLAAEGSGLSFSALTGGLDQFGRRMAVAAEGGNATAEAFENLGVKVRDEVTGELRSADDVFRETLAQLNGMEKGAERTAAANEILGRSGTKLLQALSGSQLEDFVALTNEFGVNVGPDAAQSAGEWQRASAELTLVLDGLKAELFDLLGGSDLLFTFGEAAILTFTTIGGLISGFVEGFESASQRIAAPIEAMIQAVQSLVQALEALGSGDFSGGLRNLQDALSSVRDAAAATPGAIATSLSGGVVESLLTAGFRGAEAADTEGRRRVERLREIRGSILAGGAGETPEERAERIAEEQRLEEEERKRREASRRAGGAAPAQAVDIDAQLAAMFGNEILATSNRTIRQVSQVGRAGGVVGVDLEAQRANQATLDALVAETRGGRFEAAQTGIGVAGQVLGGDLGGGISSVAGAAGLAGLGVAGAAVSGLQFIGEAGADGIRDTLEGVKDGLIAALEALPELIGQVLPQFAITLVETLIPALISNAPDIFKALLLELPLAIASAIARLLGLDRAAEGVARFAGQTEFRQNVAALGTVLSGRDVTGAARDELRDGGDRSQFGRSAARTASDGQTNSARASDRLSVMSRRRRRSAATVQTNPFDQLAQQFDSQFGTFGRAQSTTIGA